MKHRTVAIAIVGLVLAFAPLGWAQMDKGMMKDGGMEMKGMGDGQMKMMQQMGDMMEMMHGMMRHMEGMEPDAKGKQEMGAMMKRMETMMKEHHEMMKQPGMMQKGAPK